MSERFVIVIDNFNGWGISVLDTEEENAELFGMIAEEEEGAILMKYQLDTIVNTLNWQDKIMKENNLHYP